VIAVSRRLGVAARGPDSDSQRFRSCDFPKQKLPTLAQLDLPPSAMPGMLALGATQMTTESEGGTKGSRPGSGAPTITSAAGGAVTAKVTEARANDLGKSSRSANRGAGTALAPSFLKTAWQRIRHHKVGEWTLAYAATAYASMHGVVMLRETFEWPALVPQLTAYGLLLGLPVVATLAWYHGHRARSRVSGTELAILSVLLVVAGSVLWWVSRSDTTRAAAETARESVQRPPLGEKSIAVLPFTDLSQKHDQEYFADGLADEILDELAKIPGLKVIARTSAFQFKGKNDDLRSVAAKLGAAHILEGSVRVSGDRIRVTTQLIRGADGAHEWSDSYDRNVGDAIQIQREIAASLSRILQLSVVDLYVVSGSPHTVGPAAHDLFLRGRHAYQRFDKAGLEEASNFFQQALDLDPAYSDAAYMRALTHMVQASSGYVVGTEGWERARREAEGLLRDRFTAVVGHGLLARIYTDHDWNWKAAQKEIDSALALDPHNQLGLYAAGVLANSLGDWSKAESDFRAHLSRDPLDPDPRQQLASALYGAGRFPEAAVEYERAIQIDPTFAFGHLGLGETLIAMGKADAALKEIELESPDTGKQYGLACAYFLLDRKSDSDAVLSQLTKESANEKAVEIALAHACRGELDETFVWLDRAYTQKDFELSSIKYYEASHPKLKADPRWAAFLHKMNLPE